MSKQTLESTRQPIERAQENSRGTAEMARSAYSQGSPTELQRGGRANTAENHLNQAAISMEHIDFGPPKGGSSQSSGTDRYRTDEQGRNFYSHKDSQGRLTEESMTKPDGSGTARKYGKDGSRTEINWDKDHNTRTTTIDRNGRQTSIESRQANGETDRYRTDEQGRDFYSHTDSHGRLTEESMTNADGSGTAKKYGKDNSRTDINWDKEHNRQIATYDSSGRETGRESRQANGETDRYRTDEQGRNFYSHKDSQGRLTEESMTNADGSGTARKYGKDGSRTEINWDKDNNREVTAYDSNGRKVRR